MIEQTMAGPLCPPSRRDSRTTAGPAIPESPSQAKAWDLRKKRYLRAGLCHACAGQAAWGHQLGFQAVKEPCMTCMHVVLEFARDEAGLWRSQPKPR